MAIEGCMRLKWNKSYLQIQEYNSSFMRNNQFHFILMFFFAMILSCSMEAQSWNFVKEKDSIKIYTSVEDGKSLKLFRAITNINAPAEKIFAVMEDINNTEWWDKKITQIKVLHYEKAKSAQYYLVYDSPAPVTDRDLCIDVTIKTDQLTGERKINAVALNGVIPERNGIVRIKNYRQTWTIIPAGKEMTHVILEGFVDPAGAIPNWISNLLITESPLKAISGLKQRIEEK
jgi:hypothetical protein